MPLPPDFRQRLLPIVLSQSVGVLCGIFGVRLVSSIVPPATFGAYGVFLTFSTLGMWVVHSGLVKYVLRHWAGATDRSVVAQVTLRAWRRKLGWLALVSAAAAFAISRLGTISAVVAFLSLFTASSLLSLGALAQAALQAARQHWQDFVVATFGSATRTFVPPLLFLALAGAPAGMFFGFCGHTLVLAGIGAWFLRSYWSRPLTGNDRQEVSDVYDGPLFTLLAVAGWILAGQNRWVAAWRFGDVVAGYFTLASNIAMIVPSVLGAIFIQFSQPGFYALADSDRVDLRFLARRVDLHAFAFCLTGLLALGALRLVAPWLVGPIINEKYREALEWILPAGCFGMAAATGNFYHTLLIAGHREKACGPVDLWLAAALTAGTVAAALAGQTWFADWLMLTPALPWVLTRPMARRYLLSPAAGEGPAPAP